MRARKKIILSVMGVLLASACAPKVPSETRAVDVIKSYLNDYSHKFDDSFLGGKPVKEVSILSQTHLQRKWAETTAFVAFKDGTIVKVRFLLQHQLPLGWKTYGWEIVDRR